MYPNSFYLSQNSKHMYKFAIFLALVLLSKPFYYLFPFFSLKKIKYLLHFSSAPIINITVSILTFMFIKIHYVSYVNWHVSIHKWLSSYLFVLILDRFAPKSSPPVPPLLLLQGIWSLQDVFYRFLKQWASRRVQPMKSSLEMGK